ncbi:MAG: ABC transporter ATP-binding protein [Nitrospirae bacterium]|nr:ABC transporter ATP-binding protein [Nitrospirota bacterium]
MKSAYEADSVYFKYSGQWVIENVSFEIRDGEFFGIIGPNGSGKSSLLKLLSKILAPQAGQIYFRETDISKVGRRELSRTVSFIPQESSFLFPYTVTETVSMGRYPHLKGKLFEDTYDKKVVTDAMSCVGIYSLRDRPITDISGGEKQRAIIARGLAQEPDILIMDEPTTSLDIGHQMEIFNLLSRLNVERKMTIITSLHDLNIGSQYCDKIMLINRGKISAMGTPDEVITEVNIRNVYGCNVIVDNNPASGTPRVSLIPLDASVKYHGLTGTRSIWGKDKC